ncbi:integrase [Gymnodinialimonas phycosphaerae]|uniref:integrase n=1 Tax=Gymnodinialimonas phycosphaerae TaxID=2841589 RepID=UPI0021508835|nr:integrase [Gymnodinialimonas phycosphaerae]
MIEAWEARLAGNSADAEVCYEAARDLARVRGFQYLDVGAVAKLPVEDVVERVEAIPALVDQPDPIDGATLLGTTPQPCMTVTKTLDLYWTLAHEKTFGKSEDQLCRWEAPRKKAIKNFVAIIGDKDIANITRDDMLDFRQHWLDRIEAGEVTANSANKDLIHLGDVLKTENTMKRLGLDLPLGELSFKQGEARTRPPFSEDWIRIRLLVPGALNGLNDQARGIFLGMINTCYRPSEGAALSTDTIRLDCEVPHISIEADGRQLKSHFARRVIPLTGVSLEAFKNFPDGFPRYRNSASLSVVVNKFLRTNGLLETPRHSFYSLRHSFEDRMLASGIDDRIRRDLFGHRLDRERYGKGASLEHVADLVGRIAF